jgi:hypothetical protein
VDDPGKGKLRQDGPFQVTISTRVGLSDSICSQRIVGCSSLIKTQFLVLKCVKNHGETAKCTRVSGIELEDNEGRG